MTNKEAAYILSDNCHEYTVDELRTAFDLAIKALKESPQCEIIQAMSVIKSYCSTHDNCNVCPMQCNCYTDSLTSLYPDNWNIPS